jgi:hypothetical protein
MEYLRVRVPEKYLTVAKAYKILYKDYIRDAFERMVCTTIKTNRGDTDCEICENMAKRNQMIEVELNNVLEEMRQKQQAANKLETEMAGIITRAVADGKTRGEAESEFGRVFPDHIWKKYSGAKS